MNPLEQVALGWQALRVAAREAGRARMWTPWLWPFAAQLLALVALVFAAHPLLSWAMAPAVDALAGRDVVRYPELFRRLPALAGRVELVIAATLGSLAAGASTRLFADAFLGRVPAPGAAIGEALRRAPALFIANLPVHAALLALALALQASAGVRLSSLTRAALPLVVLGGGVVVQAAGAYASALVMLERRSAFPALLALPGTWAKGFLPALVLVGLCTLLVLPLHALAGQTGLIVDRGLPELTAWLSALRSGVAVVAAFLVTGGASVLFLSALATEDELH